MCVPLAVVTKYWPGKHEVSMSRDGMLQQSNNDGKQFKYNTIGNKITIKKINGKFHIHASFMQHFLSTSMFWEQSSL